ALLALIELPLNAMLRDCVFGNVRQPEFVYHGCAASTVQSVTCKIISAMKARTLISQWAAHSCEFNDVFHPNELPGLLGFERLDLGIELIPGAEPISKLSNSGSKILRIVLEIVLVRISVEKFLGLAGSYRVSLRVSPELALPLTQSLMRKGEGSLCGRYERQESFEELKRNDWCPASDIDSSIETADAYEVNYQSNDLDVSLQWFLALRSRGDTIDDLSGRPSIASWVVVDRPNQEIRSLRLAFWKGFESVGNSLKFSTGFHPFKRNTWSVREDHSELLGRYVEGCALDCDFNGQVAFDYDVRSSSRCYNESKCSLERLESLERIGEGFVLSFGAILYPAIIDTFTFLSFFSFEESSMRNKVIPFVEVLWKNHPERVLPGRPNESMRG
ncbi:hypothetical protein Tco_0712735, partial [Tanacetum coccineum]